MLLLLITGTVRHGVIVRNNYINLSWDVLILRIFLILRNFPMLQQNCRKILRIRMLVNTSTDEDKVASRKDGHWESMSDGFHGNHSMGEFHCVGSAG